MFYGVAAGGAAPASSGEDAAFSAGVPLSMACQSSPHSSLGWGVRSEPLPQRRSVAGQYRSQPQHRRSGWGGWLGNFLAMVLHGAVGLSVQRQYGARKRAWRLRQCTGLACIKKHCCRAVLQKTERPHCAAQGLCGSTGAGEGAQAVRPVLSLRRRSGRRAWSACQPPAVAASGPGSSRPALRRLRRWACRWRWRSWRSWRLFRSRSAGSVR